MTEPLAPEEEREMREHLAFLRQFKSILRLSLNAAEDLLINGAKPPSDRGLCKHLLSKIDRKTVERTLARDALKNDVAQRARFLAGVVRLNPEISILLWYLETLAAVSDKRDAAAAFALTVDRIDFSAVSNAQMAQVLEVITQTFEGHDRIQALFGLLASDTFAGALDRALPALSAELQTAFAPLRAAYRAVVLGEPPPKDEGERALIDRGIALLLDAPDRVLRSYPLELRARLAELAVHRLDPQSGAELPRSLLDSLPHHDEQYARLALARAEQLLTAHDDQQARALLSQIVQAHPKLTRAHRRLDALGWTRVGRMAIAPERGQEEQKPETPEAAIARASRGDFHLLRGFWLDGSTFVWTRLAPPAEAAKLAQEAQIQMNLILPGVTPAIAHGPGENGSAFLALAPGGRPIDASWLAKFSLADALLLALEGARILRALAGAGLELPDARLGRFLLERGGPYGVRIAELAGVEKRDPAAAAIAHGARAIELCTAIFSAGGELRADLPAPVRARLRGNVPLPVLARVLLEESARAIDGAF